MLHWRIPSIYVNRKLVKLPVLTVGLVLKHIEIRIKAIINTNFYARSSSQDPQPSKTDRLLNTGSFVNDGTLQETFLEPCCTVENVKINQRTVCVSAVWSKSWRSLKTLAALFKKLPSSFWLYIVNFNEYWLFESKLRENLLQKNMHWYKQKLKNIYHKKQQKPEGENLKIKWI